MCSHTADAIDPDDPANMDSLVDFECTQAVPQSSCLKDSAPANMKSMFVTLETSHLEMSLLNDLELQNI